MKTELGNSHSTKFLTKWLGLFQIYCTVKVSASPNQSMEATLNSTTLSLAGECDSVNVEFTKFNQIG
ncbi:hypothetical protein DSO57_1004276 [Entomophthora muscae]|uniref:Uncharacterized protein n=1 Tax=Entomophthora muscae TaxID=34485 RepID=A0ACC2RZ87_9FUNG|nr:hypothetical protein DSO57_1004276 [Entomophthora muscae]